MTTDLPGRFQVNGQWLPLQWTTARWFNCYSGPRRGNKIIAAYGIGLYKTFAYGTHTPPTELWLRHHRVASRMLQTATIDTLRTGTFHIDVDHLAEYQGTRTGQLLGREHAWTYRNEERFHIAVDARAVPLADFPRRRKIAGADIIVNGFVPWPGSEHYSGDIYKPARVPLYVVWPWPALIEAIHADQADYAGHPVRRSRSDPRLGNGGWDYDEPVPDLAEVTRTGIRADERNIKLHQLACSRYRKLGSGSPAVLDELRQVWEASDPGFSWGEVETLAESARRWVACKEQAEAEGYRDARAWLATLGPDPRAVAR